MGDQRVDDLFHFTLHDAVELVKRQVDPVIGAATLREVVGANALGAVAAADLALAGTRPLGILAAAFLIIEAGPQDLERLGLVLVLGFLVLLLDDEAGR